MNFFHLIFPCANIFFALRPCPHKFSNGPSLMPLFSLFPVGSHSSSMVFFSFLLSILKVVQCRHEMCEGKTPPQNLQSFAEWRWMCGSRKYPYLPHGRLFDLHPHPPGFSVSGGLWWPPSPQEFSEFLNRYFLPPSEIPSGFSTLKKRSKYKLSYKNMVEFYHNSVMEV